MSVQTQMQDLIFYNQNIAQPIFKLGKTAHKRTAFLHKVQQNQDKAEIKQNLG